MTSVGVCDGLCLKEYGSRIPKLSPAVSFRKKKNVRKCTAVQLLRNICLLVDRLMLLKSANTVSVAELCNALEKAVNHNFTI